MKAISLTQPMAWAVFNGKDVENRTWPTKFRGRVMIHASKKFNYVHYGWIILNDNRLCTFIPHHDSPAFVHGALIGEVDIVDCVRDSESLWAVPGQYHFILANWKGYKIPIPCRGKLGFFEPEINFTPEVK